MAKLFLHTCNLQTYNSHLKFLFLHCVCRNTLANSSTAGIFRHINFHRRLDGGLIGRVSVSLPSGWSSFASPSWVRESAEMLEDCLAVACSPVVVSGPVGCWSSGFFSRARFFKALTGASVDSFGSGVSPGPNDFRFAGFCSASPPFLFLCPSVSSV